jgi:Fe-S-cluster-containing hydrogenase component 2
MLEAKKILIDASLCRDCQVCSLACSLFHHGECSPELARLRVVKDLALHKIEINLCRQCDNPDCIAICPNEAIRHDEYGRVRLFEGECLQCGACAEACRHHAIYYGAGLGKYLKCDLCTGRPGGPVCTELCPVGALTLIMGTR